MPGDNKQPWWQRILMGGAVAEAPSIMTAAGHKIEKDGTVTVDNQNDVGVKQLRSSLPVIGNGNRLWTRWTADDQSDAKTFDEAYSNARKNGSKTFIWNNKHYSTDYSGEHHKKYEEDVKSGKAAAWEAQYPNFTNPELRKAKQEELDTYGITNEQTNNRSWLNNNFMNTISWSSGNGYPIFGVINTLLNNKPEIRKMEERILDGNLFLEEHKNNTEYLFGVPMKNKLLAISKYRQPGENEPYYYTFPHRNPTEITAGRSSEYDASTHKKLFGKDAIKEREYSLSTLVPKSIKEIARQYIDVNKGIIKQKERLEILGSTPSDRFIERLNQFNAFTELAKDNPNNGNYPIASDFSMGRYTIGITPEYKSYGDKWNLDPFGSGNHTPIIKIGKSFDFYDRFYKDKEPNIDSLYNNFQWKKQ